MVISSIDAVGGKAIEVAETLGLFSSLQQSGGDIEELALRLQVSVRGLRPLLFLLSSIGVVSQRGDQFLLAPETSEFLKNQWPARRDELPQPADWEQLEGAVRTGRCVRPAIEGESDGGSFFTGIVDTLFRLHSGMARHLHHELPYSIRKVLDLGAGSAVWSLGLLTQREEVMAVAVDHSKVLQEVTSRFVHEKGLAERFELRAGSYHDVELEAEGYDLVYLGHVIHSEGWDATRSLLLRCLKTLQPGGILAIAEWVGSEPRSQDYHANLFDLNMLMFTEAGLVFSAAEMERLVTEAGFLNPRWITGPGRHPVLLAEKAG
jgi:SAM-dependent methyltransferase